MFLGYTDDSGRFKKGENRYEVLSTVLMPDLCFSDVENLVGGCIENAVPPDKWVQFEEFKGWELYRGCGAFEGVSESGRFKAIRNLLAIVRDYRIPVVYSAVDMLRYAHSSDPNEQPLAISFRYCLKAASELMEREQYNAGPQFAMFIADEFDGKKKRLLRDTFKKNRAKIGPPGWHPLTFYIHDDMYFGDSRDSVGIQIADLCSYFIRRHLEGKKSTEEFYQIFSDQIASGEVYPHDKE